MSTGKEYNELILDLLKEQSKDISDIKEDIAELKTAKHVIKEHKAWKSKVDDVWSPPQMKEAKDEVYIHKGQWSKTIGIVIGIELVIGVILFFTK
jgi:ElaB/YqjD/DUF883 family membrane-anchored ribosome-binding protein